MRSESLARTFLTFAEKECKGSSALYQHLSMNIAKDDGLLELCRHVPEGQPVPNLLFGAIHFLLLKGTEHPLKEYYPSITANPKPYMEAFDSFKDICFTYQGEIESILLTRLVQTNEVRRCAYLYPAFSTIYEKTRKPLALIEMGTSAGLQLLWDHYSYSYGQDVLYGKQDSKLTLKAEIIGEKTPILHMTPPPISNRIGFDLHTIDIKVEEEKLWLKSLIWPEHRERLFMLEEAANYLNENPVSLVEGDGIRLLPEYVKSVPRDCVICLFHTHVANQMSSETKKQLLRTVEAIGKKRDIFHIYNNIQDSYLHMDFYMDGVGKKNTIAETDGHGRWFEWLMKNER